MSEYDVGDVIIPGNMIMITTFTGGNHQNIFHLVREFDIYESIDNFTLTADFYLADGIELTNYLPIGGEERIYLSIQTPQRKVCTYRFLVESIQGMHSNDQSNTKYYKLRCVTEDYFKNKSLLYTKRYRNLDYEDAVRQVLKFDLNVEKLVEVEPTQGVFDYTVNSVRPLQTMELLLERSVSKKYKGNKFVFYEDNEKYRFVTIEYLYEQRKAKAESFEYVYDTANRNADYEKVINVRNVLHYETLSQGASMAKIVKGASRNQVREFDILHGDYFKKYEYINSSMHMDFVKVDNTPDLNSSAWNSAAEVKPGRSIMVIKDSTRPEMKHNEFIHYKRAFEEKIFQYGLKLRVYGDTSLLVGDIIKLKMPEISGLTVSPPEQEIYSGYYFVKEIRHMFSKKENGEFEHYMILDVRKSNLKRELG